MSIRQVLNRNPAVTTVAMVVLTVAALLFAGIQFFGQRPPGAPASQAYFSIDDGKTWFADDIDKLAPFSKDGKEAARAYVFRCGSGEPFVAYLQRFTPEGKKTIEDARERAKAQKSAPPDAIFISMVAKSAGEVKKPNGTWVRDAAAQSAVTRFTCPDGSMSGLELVSP